MTFSPFNNDVNVQICHRQTSVYFTTCDFINIPLLRTLYDVYFTGRDE